GTGAPWWVPEEFAYLFLGAGRRHRFAPGVSTGLACGRAADPVLLRGLQEVLERDAVVGAWWGSYRVEEWPAQEIFDILDPEKRQRLVRPNLRYRGYRVGSPYSDHVTVVTLEGEDREGYCFSAGSACRGTRAASWEKALLEAVHGRQYVRYLKAELGALRPGGPPSSFAEHAVYYSLFPKRWRGTALAAAPARPVGAAGGAAYEGFAALAERLGGEWPVLFRCMTPPGLAQEGLDWYAL